MSPASPSLSLTTAPSWQYEPGAMTQVAALPAMSASLHGPVRIGTNEGTTSTVHPQATGLAIPSRCHRMGPSLLVVAIKEAMVVLGMYVATVAAVQRGSSSHGFFFQP